MDANQINTAFTNVNGYWNLEKMEPEEAILHDQFPMGSVWPSYPLQIQPSSSSSVVPTSSGFLNDMLGIQLEEDEEPEEELGAMKEMMYKIAAMQPVDIDPATIRKPKRRNVRISDDPQSIAARHRRERISEKIRILQRLVPGGTKLDTASMLDEAIRYVKFLKRQIRLLQSTQQCVGTTTSCSLAPGGDWPFAPPNILPSSTTSSSSMDKAVRMGFNAAENHGSGGFNHEVVSE